MRPRRGLRGPRAASRQVEGPHEEDRHLPTARNLRRTEGAAAAARGDSFLGELLDPGRVGIRLRHVRKDARCRGRPIRAAVGGLEQEDREGRPVERLAGTEVAVPASARNALRPELLDPAGKGVGLRNVQEDRAPRRRRYVRRPVLAAQQELRRLGARQGAVRAEIAAAASGGDPGADGLLDGRLEDVPDRDVEKIAEPGFEAAGRTGRPGWSRPRRSTFPAEGPAASRKSESGSRRRRRRPGPRPERSRRIGSSRPRSSAAIPPPAARSPESDPGSRASPAWASAR